MVSFISQLRPDILIWYHQDAYMIAPSEGRDGPIRARYAELTGLPMESVTGGTYTGVAANGPARAGEQRAAARRGVHRRARRDAPPDEADMHAEAVLTIAAEDI